MANPVVKLTLWKVTPGDLLDLSIYSTNSSSRIAYMGIYMIVRGRPLEEVAIDMRLDPEILWGWVYNFNRKGPDYFLGSKNLRKKESKRTILSEVGGKRSKPYDKDLILRSDGELESVENFTKKLKGTVSKIRNKEVGLDVDTLLGVVEQRMEENSIEIPLNYTIPEPRNPTKEDKIILPSNVNEIQREAIRLFGKK